MSEFGGGDKPIYVPNYRSSGFSISSEDFKEGGEIPKQCGYKHGNKPPRLIIKNIPEGTVSLAIIMDDPDAMGAVGKVWVHWLGCNIIPDPERVQSREMHYSIEELEDRRELQAMDNSPDMGVGELFATSGKTDFGENSYGGPAPPDKRHTYIFKAYALGTHIELEDGYSKQELEDAMKGNIIAGAQLTGTYAP